MSGPAEDKPEPKDSRRVPTWVITEWDEPWAKPPPAPPKFSWGLTFRILVKIGLAAGLMICAFVCFGDAFEFRLGRGHRFDMWGFILLFCLALRVLRH